jgi:hypothetical protein
MRERGQVAGRRYMDAGFPGISRLLALAALLAGASDVSFPMAANTAHAAAPAKPASPPSGYTPNRFPRREAEYYKAVWGIDALSVKVVESGEIIRFSWHVLDADKAKVLSDKKAEPALVDPQLGVSLVVPSMENIGQLRQTQPPEEGKSYWMAFSNKGRLVKRGHRINVVIGAFHGNGLVVE